MLMRQGLLTMHPRKGQKVAIMVSGWEIRKNSLTTTATGVKTSNSNSQMMSQVRMSRGELNKGL